MRTTHIESVHIHLPPQFSPEAMAAMERLMRRAGRAEPEPAAGAADVGPPPASGERWAGQGGFFVCTIPAMFGLRPRHLIAAAAERDGLAWGGQGKDAPDANSQFDGLANTIALLNDDSEHPAALYASNHRAEGHEDFFLGSRFEKLMCYWHAPQLFKKEGWYATSSQLSRYFAWAQHFEYGYSLDHNKGGEFRVRPLRCIQL